MNVIVSEVLHSFQYSLLSITCHWDVKLNRDKVPHILPPGPAHLASCFTLPQSLLLVSPTFPHSHTTRMSDLQMPDHPRADLNTTPSFLPKPNKNFT